MTAAAALICTANDRAISRKFLSFEAVTFSQLGLFSGGESSDQIDVEGYTSKSEKDRGSAMDVVGSNYFSTLGVRSIMGRDILDSDREGPKVCVINEAFAKNFLEGRNPIGLHLTRIEDNGIRDGFQVVGVARNLRFCCLPFMRTTS